MKFKCLIGLLAAAALSLPSSASAALALVVTSPASWRLQDYVGGSIWVFYTGAAAPCVNGGLTFPSTATVDELNRFWSLILTAKRTSTQVGVYFDNVTCQISSFYDTP